MPVTSNRPVSVRLAGADIALSLGLALSGCGGMPTNRSLESVHQPVVERNLYTFDVNTLTGGGVPVADQRRLADWFETLGLRYGDRVSVDDPVQSGATRTAVEAVAARFGLLLADTAPVTEGVVPVGMARVVITRTTASVPGCPDWSAKSDANFGNGASSNFGCATNANLAAMVADKEHLVHGATGTGDTVVMSSTKAISTYRDAKPTGGGGTTVKQQSSQSGVN